MSGPSWQRVWRRSPSGPCSWPARWKSGLPLAGRAGADRCGDIGPCSGGHARALHRGHRARVVTWNGSVPQARTHGGSGDEPAAGSDPRIESAARDLAFSAELATMGLIPSEDVTELPAPLPAAPEPAATGQVSDRIDAYLPRRTRPGVARRSPFSAGPRLSRALRPLGAALRRTVLEPSLAADVRRDRELATGLRATTSGCRRVLVLSAGPGCGQTSAAALIALTLSRVRDDRVAAVDLDASEVE